MPYQATAIRPRMMAGMFAPRTPKEIREATGYGVPVAWRRPGDQVAQEVHDGDADQQGDQHLPGRQTEREQAARGDVAADAVHIGHPEREEVVGAPGLLLQRREVLVGQPRRVTRLDQPGAGQVLVIRR